MGSIPVPSTKTKGCPEVARLMTSFFCFPRFQFFHVRAPYYTLLFWLPRNLQFVRKKAEFHGQAHQNHNLYYTEKG